MNLRVHFMTPWMDLLRRKRTCKVRLDLINPTHLIPVLGEYKTILQLVGVLSHGKVAKRLADRAVDLMQDVQNLRKAIYE